MARRGGDDPRLAAVRRNESSPAVKLLMKKILLQVLRQKQAWSNIGLGIWGRLVFSASGRLWGTFEVLRGTKPGHNAAARPKRCTQVPDNQRADVAELADALDSKSA